MASAIACEPPTAAGQPTPWPSSIERSGRSRPSAGSRAAASSARRCPRAAPVRARPAKRARARPVAERRPRAGEARVGERVARHAAAGRAGRRRAAPSRARAGCISVAVGVARRGRGPPPSRRPSGAARRRCRRRAGARAGSRDGRTRARARSSGRLRRNGEASASGWIAEQTSWRKPGSVSSAVRVPPPIVAAASSTSTERPAWASAIAAARPFGPGADDDRVPGIRHVATGLLNRAHRRAVQSAWKRITSRLATAKPSPSMTRRVPTCGFVPARCERHRAEEVAVGRRAGSAPASAPRHCRTRVVPAGLRIWPNTN